MSATHAGGAPLTATAIASPWGPVHVAVSEEGVVAVELTTTSEAFAAGLEARRHRPVRLVEAGEVRPALLERAIRALGDALAGRVDERAALDALPLDLADRPAFDREVLAAVRAIPRGEVRSYGEIARAIGRPGAARAVGGAVGRNPVAMLVPCHRVVAGDGTLGGYGGGWWGDHERNLDVKAALLAGEGIRLPRSRPRADRGR
ncbi:MAG TPA: methylated-DNA--[protein]-cysteine S-methyltransferase [Candidatus Limnocylindrales bacterium]|nr:methylated-DNA--[protein]-cysteine S-methyltransferase [Candidatus Limnocylindrales bacterium]